MKDHVTGQAFKLADCPAPNVLLDVQMAGFLDLLLMSPYFLRLAKGS